jgi:XTP/dITP diphosphohydrolase
MATLLFATNNQHKVTEIQSAIGRQIDVISLAQAGIDVAIPEPHDTLEGNASEKSRTVYGLTGLNCFGEDTGLEVLALKGEPGVKSARYAGEEKNFDENLKKLLKRLGADPDRRAKFRAVISLIWNGSEHLFEGVCEGTISYDPRGSGGFGYDPVFIPSGSDKTFAEMDLDEKNKFSHRKRAADKLVLFLKESGF